MLTENTTNCFLSIASSALDYVLVWSLLHIDPVTQVIPCKQDCDDSATMHGYFQRDIEKLCWETIKGNLKRDLIGWQPLFLWVCSAFCRDKPPNSDSDSVNLLLSCPESTWHCYLALLTATHDLAICVCVCIITNLGALPLSYRTRIGVTPAEEIKLRTPPLLLLQNFNWSLLICLKAPRKPRQWPLSPGNTNVSQICEDLRDQKGDQHLGPSFASPSLILLSN